MLAGSDIPGNDTHSEDIPDISVFEIKEDESTKPAGSQQPEKPGNSGKAPFVFEIDPKFATLPKEEAIKRSAQSTIDRIKQEKEELLQRYERASKYERFFDVLQNDPTVAQAFARKLNPAIYENMDVDTLVKQELQKDPRFKDFDYRPEEALIPGSKSWRYNKEYASLEDKLKNSAVKDFDTLVQERSAANQAAIDRLTKEVTEVKTKYGYDDTGIKRINDWFNALSFSQRAQIFAFAATRRTTKTPSPNETSHSFVKAPANEIERQVSDLLGPPKSGVAAKNIIR